MTARDGIYGRYQGEVAPTEASHYFACAACGGLIDCRDLGQVIAHEGPLPHAIADQKQ